MKLYYMPGACSLGIRVLLEEIGKPYDLHKVDGAKQEQYGPDFVKLNPKSKVLPTSAWMPNIVEDNLHNITGFIFVAGLLGVVYYLLAGVLVGKNVAAAKYSRVGDGSCALGLVQHFPADGCRYGRIEQADDCEHGSCGRAVCGYRSRSHVGRRVQEHCARGGTPVKRGTDKVELGRGEVLADR